MMLPCGQMMCALRHNGRRRRLHHFRRSRNIIAEHIIAKHIMPCRRHGASFPLQFLIGGHQGGDELLFAAHHARQCPAAISAGLDLEAIRQHPGGVASIACLLYTSDAADDTT